MDRRGFTLIELVVVVMIIAILAGFGLTSFIRSSEETKAQDAVGQLRLAAAADKMYAAEHAGAYVAGTLTNSCNSQTCGSTTGPCALVACHYLPSRDWDAYPYWFVFNNTNLSQPMISNPIQASDCTGGDLVCSFRKNEANCPGCPAGTKMSISKFWSYVYGSETTPSTGANTVTEANGAPAP